MPKFQKAITWLITCCSITVITLYCIQYYLIKNTYDLNKEKYLTDVEEAINKILLDANMATSHLNSLSALKESFYQKEMQKAPLKWKQVEKIIKDFKAINDTINISGKKKIKQNFANNKLLRNINLNLSYDKIIIQYKKGKKTTQILAYSNPITIIGKKIDSKNSIYLSKELIRSSDLISLKEYENTDKEETFTFFIHYSKSIDISKAGKEIFMRMLGIFLLAAGLILVITILFYIILSNLIKQRKIADIKTDFANNVSHELKTPLASLNIIVKTLTKKAVLEDKKMFRETLQALKRQNERLQRITNSILESSLYENKDLILEDIEMRGFLSEFLNDFKASITSHKILLDIKPKEQWLKLDSVKLQSVLNNILENAIKYSPEESEIEIRSSLQDNFYVISIKDKGIGIAKSNYKQIFEKFYRVTEDKNIHANKGLGLGLYLSSKYITKLGGIISLESEIGKGSTFFIKIPVNED